MRFYSAKRAAFFALALIAVPTLITAQTRLGAEAQPFQVQPPTTSILGMNTYLSVSISPYKIINGTQTDEYLHLRLYDPRTNYTVPFVQYEISVARGFGSEGKPIFHYLFTSPTGFLTLDVRPTPSETYRFFDVNYDDVDGYSPDASGIVRLSGPLFLDGGAYHVHTTIWKVNHQQISSDAIAGLPSFDSEVFLGEQFNHEFVVNGQSHNASLISYYDKISEFNFNPRNNTFSWAVPFDWNVSKTSFASNFIVHEEVWLPKNWSGIGDTSYFSGSVNGFKLPNRELLIDPFSYPNQLVVHFLLGKIDVLRLAQELGHTEDVQMHFELLPIVTSSEWSGDRTSILANWNSAQLAAGRNVTVNLKFIDSESAEGQKKINGTVLYDLNFTDMLGNDLVSKTNLVAINGEDNETLIFPYNSSYSIEARIISIGAATGSPAEDKLNIATGFVVVPEFKFAALVVLAVPTALAVILARKWLGNSDTR